MSSSSGSLQLPDSIQSENELSLAADAEVAGTDDVSMPSFVSEASAAGPHAGTCSGNPIPGLA